MIGTLCPRPASGCTAAYPARYRRPHVANATDDPNGAHDDAADHTERATSDRDTAVVLAKPRTSSRDYQLQHPTSLVKSP